MGRLWWICGGAGFDGEYLLFSAFVCTSLVLFVAFGLSGTGFFMGFFF